MASTAPFYEGPHLFLTVADEDENQVLEFVRSDETGMYIRDSESWVKIDPDEDNERVWDRVIIDVTEEAVSVFDQAEQAESVTADLFNDYLLDEEPQQ